jgi:hypothetical protein
LIDVDDVGVRGAHALFIDGERVRLETVADARGDRPWAPKRQQAGVSHDWVDEEWPSRGRRGQ